MIDNILYYVDPMSHHLHLAVPLSLQQQLMKEAHSGALSEHFETQGMYHSNTIFFGGNVH